MDPISFAGGIAANIATEILLHLAPALESTLAGKALRGLGLLPPKISDILREALTKALALLVQEHPDYDLSGIATFLGSTDMALQLGGYILNGKPIDEGQIQHLFDRYLADEHLTRNMIKLRGYDPQQIVHDFLDCYRSVLRMQSGEPQMALLLAIIEQTSTVLAAVQGSEERIISAIGVIAAQLAAQTPSPLESANLKIVEAKERAVNSDYEGAARLFEEAVALAGEAHDVELERSTRLSASRSWDAYLVRSQLSEGECRYVLAQIERQIHALEVLQLVAGVDGVTDLGTDIAIERARLAIHQRDGVTALRWANQALADAEEGSQIWADGLITSMHAYWQLKQPEKALALADLVTRAQSEDVGAAVRLVVSATWLRTLCKVGKAIGADVAAFCKLARDLAQDPAFGAKQAMMLVGEVAEEFNRGGELNTTLTLLELAYELGEDLADPTMVSSAALQVAEVAAYAGQAAKVSLFLGRASTWIDKVKSAKAPRDEVNALWCNLRAKWLYTKGRIFVTMAELSKTTDQPVEEMLRQAFDVFAEAKQFILDHRAQLSGDIELFLAELHWWWGGAASALNWYSKAVELFRAVRSEAAMAHSYFSLEVGMGAWLREAESLALAGRLEEASNVVDALLADDRAKSSVAGVNGIHVQPRAERFRAYLNATIRPTVDWFGTSEAREIMKLSKRKSLREAVAEQVAPLVSWWTWWVAQGGHRSGPEAELLDFWGRGGFARVVAAIRAEPHKVIAVDAWSIEDIRRWARILCPLFETVFVKWKGELSGGMLMAPMHRDYGGPGTFGGHGYEITSTAIDDEWAIAVGWANPLPPQVARFLATEALPLIQAGRLLVIPASLVGCTQSAVGWTDNLLVDGLLNGAVNIARRPPGPIRDYIGRQRVLDLSAISIPYIEDIGLDDMALALEETEEWLARLRSLLLKSILSDDLRHERWESIIIIEFEIQDACKELRSQFERLAAAGKWYVSEVEGSLTAASHGASVGASEPMTNLLRSISSTQTELAPWIPYWRMNNLGGRLDWSCPLDNPSNPPPRPDMPRDLHSWLFPGTGGWGIRTQVILPAEAI